MLWFTFAAIEKISEKIVFAKNYFEKPWRNCDKSDFAQKHGF